MRLFCFRPLFELLSSSWATVFFQALRSSIASSFSISSQNTGLPSFSTGLEEDETIPEETSKEETRKTGSRECCNKSESRFSFPEEMMISLPRDLLHLFPKAIPTFPTEIGPRNNGEHLSKRESIIPPPIQSKHISPRDRHLPFLGTAVYLSPRENFIPPPRNCLSSPRKRVPFSDITRVSPSPKGHVLFSARKKGSLDSPENLAHLPKEVLQTPPRMGMLPPPIRKGPSSPMDRMPFFPLAGEIPAPLKSVLSSPRAPISLLRSVHCTTTEKGFLSSEGTTSVLPTDKDLPLAGNISSSKSDEYLPLKRNSFDRDCIHPSSHVSLGSDDSEDFVSSLGKVSACLSSTTEYVPSPEDILFSSTKDLPPSRYSKAKVFPPHSDFHMVSRGNSNSTLKHIGKENEPSYPKERENSFSGGSVLPSVDENSHSPAEDKITILEKEKIDSITDKLNKMHPFPSDTIDNASRQAGIKGGRGRDATISSLGTRVGLLCPTFYLFLYILVL